MAILCSGRDSYRARGDGFIGWFLIVLNHGAQDLHLATDAIDGSVFRNEGELRDGAIGV